jgi:hypothetical protein
MKIQVFNSSYLCFTEGPDSWGILVDPANEWKHVAVFLEKNQIKLRYLILSEATFQKGFRINQIKLETGAKFLGFQSDMIPLRNFPKLADHVNVCGIKSPQMDRFLDGFEQIDLDGKVLKIKSSGKTHQYQIDGQDIPALKVETPSEME